MQHSADHPHCDVCGSCLMWGRLGHRCWGDTPMDPEVAEVFHADMRPQDARVREPLPRGYQTVTEAEVNASARTKTEARF